MSRHREARRSRTLVAAATAALLLVAVNVLAGPGPRSSAQTPGDPPFTVTVAQTDDLVDGQLVDVEIAMRPGLVAVDATAYLCRPGQTYATTAHVSQNGGNCPVSVSPSAAAGETANWRLHLFTGGGSARGTVAAGIGTAEWDSTVTGGRFSLTCGPSDPCLLVVRVQARPAGGGTIQQLFDASTTLTYQDSDPLASCGGAAPDAVRSAGAERMLSAWREWTVSQCAADPQSPGAATLAPVPDEGLAVAGFHAGDRDVVYTAAGTGEPGFSPATTRATVPVPVAVNAVVLAAAGGHFTAGDPNWPPTLSRAYGEIRLSAEEIALLLGQGQIHLAGARGDDVLARNPQLGAVYPTANARAPLALSSASAMTLYLTRYLDELAGGAWTAGPELGLAPRGVNANLGVPESPDEPTFANALSMVSDQSLVDRAVITRILEMSPNSLGPQWVWTDLATATRLSMTPVSLQNAAGEWVAPTPESLAAAIPGMQRREDGTLAPDVATTAPGAYPLTIVEYALAPAEPLHHDDCAARTGTQQLLGMWLDHITGDGQAVLPEGYVPLTPALHAEADAAIAKVGATPSTTCTSEPGPTTTTQPPGATPTTQPPGGVPTGGAPSFDASSGPSGRDASPHGGTTPRASTPDDREEAAEAVDEAEIETPPFRGVRALNELMSPLALLLIVVATSGSAFVTSGREVPAGARAMWRLATGAGRYARRGLSSTGLALRLPGTFGRGTP